MKKIISVLLASLLIFSSFALAGSAATAKGNEYPIILVTGRGQYIPYYMPDGRQIFPVKPTTDYITDALKVCLPILGKGLVTGDLDPWAEKLGEVIAPLYADLIPDKDGKITNGSRSSLLDGYGKAPTKGTGPYDYAFYYDWRKDPCESADYLDNYIRQIKELEGCDKVSIVGRCYGGNVISAYLYEYGHADIDTAVYYCSTALGCYASGTLFAGEIKIDPAVLESFLEGTDLFDDPVLNELLRATVSYLNTFCGLDSLTDIADLLIEKLFPAAAPVVAPLCYGSMPCFWDMVDNERYEKAKALVFAGQEEEYAALLEMTDHYHYDIIPSLPSMLRRYAAEGLNVGVLAKYGMDALYPIYDNGSPQSDDTVELKYSTFGATCSRLGETLSEAYRRNADPAYLSSDGCVDASTALFKDSTWIVKNISHSNFDVCLDNLMAAVCNFDGQMTVADDPAYPQFLNYDNGALTGLTEAPADGKSNPVKDYFSALIRFFKAIFALIGKLFK